MAQESFVKYDFGKKCVCVGRVSTASQSQTAQIRDLEDFAKKLGYEEVKLPKRVMKRSDADEFVSVLYTLLDGVYYKDNDDKTVSATNIGSVSENDGHYSVSQFYFSKNRYFCQQMNFSKPFVSLILFTFSLFYL